MKEIMEKSELIFRYGQSTVSEYFNLLENTNYDIIEELFINLLPDDILVKPPIGRWWSPMYNLDMILNLYKKDKIVMCKEYINLFSTLILLSLYIMSTDYDFNNNTNICSNYIYYAFNFSEMELDKISIIDMYHIKTNKEVLPELILLFNMALYMREIELDIESISRVMYKTQKKIKPILDIRNTLNTFEPNSKFAKRVMMNIALTRESA